jgi:alpha-tubulin suppressor-like RCC1 family protein
MPAKNVAPLIFPDAGKDAHDASPHDAHDVEAADAGVDVVAPDAAVWLSSSPYSQNACVVLGSGDVYCWGDNEAGELGNGTSDMYSATPAPVSRITGATALSTGDFVSCAVAHGGAVCWGGGVGGELGDGTSEDALTPMPVVGLSSGVSAITVGGYTAVRSSGRRGHVLGSRRWERVARQRHPEL